MSRKSFKSLHRLYNFKSLISGEARRNSKPRRLYFKHTAI
nr:MAG TPA: hypothetical protein [Caudoviricetes sp.]